MPNYPSEMPTGSSGQLSPLASTLIGVGTNLLSNYMNNSAQMTLNDHNQHSYQEMQNLQRSWAMDDWTRQNDYNSPAAQMQRFKTAGLNPNLIYGQTNSAAPIRSNPGAAPPKQEAPHFDFGGIGQALSGMYEILRTNAQTDNFKAQAELAKTNLGLAEENIVNRRQDLSFKHDSQDYLLEQMQMKNRILDKQGLKLDADTNFTISQNERNAALTANTLTQGVEKILNMRLDRQKTTVGIEQLHQIITNMKQDYRIKTLEENFNKSGMTKSDPLYMRLLNKAFNIALDPGYDDYENYQESPSILKR